MSEWLTTQDRIADIVAGALYEWRVLHPTKVSTSIWWNVENDTNDVRSDMGALDAFEEMSEAVDDRDLTP